MNIDCKEYKQSITSSRFWKIVAFYAIVYILYEIFLNFINNVIVENFLSKFPQTVVSSLFFLLLLVYCGQKIREIYKYGLLPSLSSFVFSVFLLVFYLCLVRLNNNYILFPLSFAECIKYTDVVTFTLILFFLEFRAFNNPLLKNSLQSLISDQPDPNEQVDLIESESYVKKISQAINETACQLSFSIGVFASWGSGKTDFIMRLKKSLLLNEKENIIVEFNPWKVSSTETIIEDFFKLLSQALKPYNKTVAPILREYSKKILSTGKEIEFRIIDTFLNELVKEPTLDERYSYINNSIKSTGKRLIILIDDLDRMSGFEVINILRLIRNTANFSNTFFIAALDHAYVINVLEKTDSVSNEESFLKKIFQLIVTIPSIRKDTFANEIVKLLQIDKLPFEDANKIQKSLSVLKYSTLHEQVYGMSTSRPEGYLEKMLDNYRDIKRLCNSFKINFEILKNEVEITDLFLLELIKVKSFSAYENISNRMLLDISPERSSFTLHEKKWEELAKISNLDKLSQSNLKNVIEFLVTKSEAKSHRQFSYPHNFYLYFCFQLFNLISLEDFQNTLDLPWKKMSDQFRIWIDTGKSIDLYRILDNISDYKDKDELEKFLKVYLSSNTILEFSVRARNIVMNVDKNIKSYFESEANYKDFVRKILADDILPEYSRATIANEFLKNSIYENRDLLLSKKELQDIIDKLFGQYLEKQHKYDFEVYAFYLMNDDSRTEGSNIILNPSAHKRMRNFLKNDTYFDEYLIFLIRSYQIPTDGRFVFSPFTYDIFINWENFKKRIIEHVPLSNEVKNLKQIIIYGTDQFIQGDKYFILTGDERDKVLNHLKRTKQYIN